MRLSKESGKSPIWNTRPTFLHSDRPLAKYVGRPAAEFLRIEPSGGIVLLACAAIALLWANSPWSGSYDGVWGMEIVFDFGGFELHHSLKDWINDGLMAFFFFVVGMEIKSEIVAGHLRDVRNAVAPIAGAIGGMVAPAAIYLAFNAGTDAAHGWGIPMATDIAFAIGILALFGDRIPSPARIFLLTLAIVDDLGAIAVIALFYTDDLSTEWLLVAGVLVVVAVALRVLNVWYGPVYLVIGVLLWLATLESGVHATVAGVVMGFIISARPLLDPRAAHSAAQEMAEGGLTHEETERISRLAKETVPPTQRLQHRFHPFSSFLVLPLFALANAGMPLSADMLSAAIGSAVTVGIAGGLVVGKFGGVILATWIAVKAGLGRLPEGTSWRLLSGLAAVAGVGFTVALFITELAFRGGDAGMMTDEAKLGVLGGSLLAACLGAALLKLSTPKRTAALEDATGER
ncbi:Na+/H+ antiporter NhaA [Glycomyces xiaoerkulensis]|uniref:Na+/H+ antiporter NhaA n=1 Tax=Glycomyces xiaoerkulensis TaxID=2038139 RepID=UPI000C25606E|nr:Na+/H+ antiporter NhaA [Glycomyces xiaoerkulensis]